MEELGTRIEKHYHFFREYAISAMYERNDCVFGHPWFELPAMGCLEQTVKRPIVVIFEADA